MVRHHYKRPDLKTALIDALKCQGKCMDTLKMEDIAAIDEFHVRGRAATLEIADTLSLNSAQHVLDVGSGIGGPSRCIAQKFGCRVTGIDLADEYCQIATMLAEHFNLSSLVNYLQGNALNLPFADATFDVIWTQHTAMNILDKDSLYQEMHRVLKPGGTLAIYDILAGCGGPVLFPAPWARTPETSFVITPDELRRYIEMHHFTITHYSDTTDIARIWFTKVVKKIRQAGLPPVGFHLLFGSDYQVMAENQQRNLDEGRIAVVQIAAKK